MVLAVSCQRILSGMQVGDSVAVNGICLTVIQIHSRGFTADVMAETVQRTNLRIARVGSVVNLERAVAAGSRLGGHWVSGHVDATAVVAKRSVVENAVVFRFCTTPTWTAYMVPKGSIAVDGISLTLIDVTEESFSVSVIPHTLQVTNLQHRQVGDTVNIECDLIGKYVVAALGRQSAKEGPTEMTCDFLRRNGFV